MEENRIDVYWREVVHTAIYILNRGLLRLKKNKNPYELLYGRQTTMKYFRVFGRKSYIRRDKDILGKFDSRYDEGIFLGYSSSSKPYRCY